MYELICMMGVIDLMAISIETPQIDRGYSLKK